MFEGIKRRLGIKENVPSAKPAKPAPTQPTTTKTSLREKASKVFTKIKNFVSGKKPDPQKNTINTDPIAGPTKEERDIKTKLLEEIKTRKGNSPDGNLTLADKQELTPLNQRLKSLEGQRGKGVLKNTIITLHNKEQEVKNKLLNSIREKNRISGTKTLTPSDRVELTPLKKELDLIKQQKEAAVSELKTQAEQSVKKLEEIGQKVNATKQTLIDTVKPLVADKTVKERLAQKQAELASTRATFNEALSQKKSKQELLPLLKAVKRAELGVARAEATRGAEKNVQSILVSAAKAEKGLVDTITAKAAEARGKIKALDVSPDASPKKQNDRNSTQRR